MSRPDSDTTGEDAMCLACGASPPAPHVRIVQHHIASRAVAPDATVPLCSGCHAELHGESADLWRQPVVVAGIGADLDAVERGVELARLGIARLLTSLDYVRGDHASRRSERATVAAIRSDGPRRHPGMPGCSLLAGIVGASWTTRYAASRLEAAEASALATIHELLLTAVWELQLRHCDLPGEHDRPAGSAEEVTS